MCSILYCKYYHRTMHTCMTWKQHTEKSLVWLWTKINFLWFTFFWFIKKLSWRTCTYLVEFEYLCYYTVLSRSLSIFYKRKTKLLDFKVRCIVYLAKYSGTWYVHRMCVRMCIFVRSFYPVWRNLMGCFFNFLYIFSYQWHGELLESMRDRLSDLQEMPHKFLCIWNMKNFLKGV